MSEEKAASMPCPECGSTEREQKSRCVVCADCRVVLIEQSTQQTFAATQRKDGGFDVR